MTLTVVKLVRDENSRLLVQTDGRLVPQHRRAEGGLWFPGQGDLTEEQITNMLREAYTATGKALESWLRSLS